MKNLINLEPSATLAINEKSKNLILQGKKVFRFGFGQSPFPVPEKIVSTLKENADKKAATLMNETVINCAALSTIGLLLTKDNKPAIRNPIKGRNTIA